jgi:ABC-2 type transport system permease protein
VTAAATTLRPHTPTAARRTVLPGTFATFLSELRAMYREPQALIFTLLQPFLLLVILDSFNLETNGRPYIDMLLPGMMAFNGMTVGLNSTAFVMARYKQRGILRRIRSTPLPTGAFLGGFILSRIVITLGVTIVTYVTGVYVLDAHLEGSTFWMIALTLAGAIVFISIGLLMVAFARSEDDMPPMFVLVLMPSILFSGAFLPRGGLPEWLEFVTRGLPLSYLTGAIQEVSKAGGSVLDVGPDLAGLAVWGLGATVLCFWRFRMS